MLNEKSKRKQKIRHKKTVRLCVGSCICVSLSVVWNVNCLNWLFVYRHFVLQIWEKATGSKQLMFIPFFGFARINCWLTVWRRKLMGLATEEMARILKVTQPFFSLAQQIYKLLQFLNHTFRTYFRMLLIL